MLMKMQELKSNIFRNYTMAKNVFSKDFWEYHTKDPVLIYYSDFNQNWGDYINPYLIEKITRKKTVSAKRIFKLKKHNERIFGVGSILNTDLKDGVIWGSGFIKEPEILHNKPKKVLAVRGKRTAAVLEKFQIPHNNVYGDPALLFPTFYQPEKKKKYKLGIVPHYTEINYFFSHKDISGNKDIQVISPIVKNHRVHEIIDKIAECEQVISSSLHGLILADAYGIPSARFTYKNKIIGDNFKYDDYYSGVGVSSYNTYRIKDLNSLNIPEILRHTQKQQLKFSPLKLKEALLNHIIQ